MIKDLSGKTKKEQEILALKECMCKTCPSFQKCKEKIAYCVLGKSKCINKRIGCICGGCPVHKKLNLEGYYFCMK